MSPLCRMGSYDSSLYCYTETTLNQWRSSNSWWNVADSDWHGLGGRTNPFIDISGNPTNRVRVSSNGSVTLSNNPTDYPDASGGAELFLAQYPRTRILINIGGRDYHFFPGTNADDGSDADPVSGGSNKDFFFRSVEPEGEWTEANIEDGGNFGWTSTTKVIIEVYTS